jgi:electron transport complex protein RnfC
LQTDLKHIITRIKQGQFWSFPGGVQPKENKRLSNDKLLREISLPRRLYLTVKPQMGVAGEVIVKVHDEVLKGQPLTHSSHPLFVPLHAPTSGKIARIGSHVASHPSGLSEETIELIPDREDRWCELDPSPDYKTLGKADLVKRVCNAGICGMGGAGFPTHIKTSQKKAVDFLIINGVECEPYISCDDRLMREHSETIKQGIDILRHVIRPKKVIIAVEDNKPEALAAMQAACQKSPHYLICSVPTQYPSGGEKQLIQVLTGKEVPVDGLPIDIGMLMYNVATCYAVAEAIIEGKPLIQRVVTLTGKALQKPGNVWAALGTPISHLMNQGKYDDQLQKQKRVIIGGPMMGFSVHHDKVPVSKTTNCVLVPADNELANEEPEQPCIRCGACADSCPAGLLPQQLFWYAQAGDFDKLSEYHLQDCIECGICSFVCPSRIPLVQYYRQSKAEIKLAEEEQVRADKARVRFEDRKLRLEKEQKERQRKQRAAAKARKARLAESGQGEQADKVAAALARAKAKKAAQQQQSSQQATDIVSEDTKVESTGIADTVDIQSTGSAQSPVAPNNTAEVEQANIQKTEIDTNQASQQALPATDKNQTQLDLHIEQQKGDPDTQIKQDEVASNSSDSDETNRIKQSKIAAAVAKVKAKQTNEDAQ